VGHVPVEPGNKAIAVRREMAGWPSQTLPVYFGDDLSDEAVLVALRIGVSVRVGTNRRSRACYRVDSAADFRHFLGRLESESL
jgi:trehalose-6-phosphatase